MVTGKPLKGGGTYIRRHLEANDYYSEQEKVKGQWTGRGAEILGLSGDVDAEQLNRMGEAQNPHTGEKLRMRVREDGRSYFDFVCSAGKSFSVMAMVDDRIPEMHRQ